MQTQRRKTSRRAAHTPRSAQCVVRATPSGMSPSHSTPPISPSHARPLIPPPHRPVPHSTLHFPAACPLEAEKRTALEFVNGGGGSKEWQQMNQRNVKKFNNWHKKSFRQHNRGRQIGLPMIQVEH